MTKFGIILLGVAAIGLALPVGAQTPPPARPVAPVVAGPPSPAPSPARAPRASAPAPVAAPAPVSAPVPAPARVPRAPVAVLVYPAAGRMRQEVAAAPGVVVRLGLRHGDIIVRGGNQAKVAAEAVGAPGLVLERTDGGDENTPATQLEVNVRPEHNYAHGEDPANGNDSGVVESLTLYVPSGASVYLRTLEGDVRVYAVAEAHVEVLDGDLHFQQMMRFVEASTLGGDISAVNLQGRIALVAVSGDVSVRHAQPAQPGDYLKARSTNGSVTLDDVTHTNVYATSVSGDITWRGPLAHGGEYMFKNTSGDVTAWLSPDASFKLSAKVAYGEIDTAFACTPDESHKGATGRLAGVCGKGEANLQMESFSGTITLRKAEPPKAKAKVQKEPE